MIGAAAGMGWLWWHEHQTRLPPGIASGNGRLESDEIDIDTRCRPLLSLYYPLDYERKLLQSGDSSAFQPDGSNSFSQRPKNCVRETLKAI